MREAVSVQSSLQSCRALSRFHCVSNKRARARLKDLLCFLASVFGVCSAFALFPRLPCITRLHEMQPTARQPPAARYPVLPVGNPGAESIGAARAKDLPPISATGAS
jgi:hypothetical protein